MNAKLWLAAAVFALLFASVSIGYAAGARKEGQMAYDGFNSPTGMAYDNNGILYVSEWSCGRIVAIKDGNASIVLEGLHLPSELAFDESDNLYIAGYGDGNIYIWDGKGRPQVLASGFSAPTGLSWSNDKNLLVANRNAGELVEINADGRKKVISRGHKTPVGAVQTEDGHLFISCYGGSVDIVSPNGKISSISTGLDTPGVGIIPAGSNSVYVVDYARGNIAHVNTSGVQNIIAKDLLSPVALAMMPDKNLIVGCWGDNSLHIIPTLKGVK